MNSGRLMELLETVEQRYNIVAEDVASYRGNLLIRCNRTKKLYVLKRVECDEKRLLFTYRLQKHIIENGFEDCECYVPCKEVIEGASDSLEEGLGKETVGYIMQNNTSDDELNENLNENLDERLNENLNENLNESVNEPSCVLSFVDRESEWGLCEYIEGRESNFDDETELLNICAALADMHIASNGFACSDIGMAQTGTINKLGKMPAVFTKRLAELEKLRKKAMKDRKDFDIEYMKNAPAFIEWGRAALEHIDTPTYALLVKQAALEGGVSHCDLTYQNILVQEDCGRVFFTGFESACFELNIYDVANLIRRKMRKCNWDFSIAMKMVEAYDKKRELADAEISTLKGILLFPQKFWRIANSYYNMNKAWTHRNMKEKLLDATAEKEDFAVFAKQLISTW